MTDFQSLISIAILNAAALAASMLLLARGAGRRLPGCGEGSGCDAVSSSRWSRMGRVPVALLGTVAYAGMIASALLLAFERAPAWPALLGLSVLAGGAAVWFIFIQVLVLRRFCLYCMIAQSAAIGAAAIVWLPGPPWNEQTQHAAIIGAAALGALVLAQIVIRPKLYKFAEPKDVLPEPVQIPPPVPIAPTPPPATAPPPSPPPQNTRRVSLLGGRLSFDAWVFPLLGDPNAKHLIADLMDYTCEHCRAAHPMLDAAFKAFNGELAILLAYAPLERSCNPHVQIVNPRYARACDYARLALAVWETAPAQFAGFHRWLLEGTDPPPLETAKQRAVQLSSEQAIEQAIAGPRVQQMLADGVSVYRVTGARMLPKLLLPTGLLTGEVSSEERLITLLRQQLSGTPVAPPSQTRPTALFSARPIE